MIGDGERFEKAANDYAAANGAGLKNKVWRDAVSRQYCEAELVRAFIAGALYGLEAARSILYDGKVPPPLPSESATREEPPEVDYPKSPVRGYE